MTILERLQEAAKLRHRPKAKKVKVSRVKRKPHNHKPGFYGNVWQKRAVLRKKEPVIEIIPDLMDEMTIYAPEIVGKKNVEPTPFIPEPAKYVPPPARVVLKPIAPPKKHSREIFRRVPDLPQEEKIQRPAAIYTNIPSPYGIATEMLQEQIKK